MEDGAVPRKQPSLRRVAGILLLLLAVLPALPQQLQNLSESDPRWLGPWETTDAIFAAAFGLRDGSERLRSALAHDDASAGVLLFQSPQNRGNTAVAMAMSRIVWPRPLVARVVGANDSEPPARDFRTETILFHGVQPPEAVAPQAAEVAPGLRVLQALSDAP